MYSTERRPIPVLQLIMDVSTRWDSTGLMMIRALRLRHIIDQYTRSFEYAQPFALSDSEWKKIQYLVDIVRPFNFFTTNIGRTKSITLPYALSIYNILFERLTESRRRLQTKLIASPWVEELIAGIDATEAKLDKYYYKVYTNLGSLYGIGALLNPKLKAESFNQDYCWLDFNAQPWDVVFEQQLQSLYTRDYTHQDQQNTDRLQALRHQNKDPLAALLEINRLSRDIQSDNPETINTEEVSEWLAMSKFL
jgi:hypothetical protein